MRQRLVLGEQFLLFLFHSNNKHAMAAVASACRADRRPGEAITRHGTPETDSLFRVALARAVYAVRL